MKLYLISHWMNISNQPCTWTMQMGYMDPMTLLYSAQTCAWLQSMKQIHLSPRYSDPVAEKADLLVEQQLHQHHLSLAPLWAGAVVRGRCTRVHHMGHSWDKLHYRIEFPLCISLLECASLQVCFIDLLPHSADFKAMVQLLHALLCFLVPCLL